MNLPLWVGRDQVCVIDGTGQTIIANGETDHQVETQQGQIIEVVLGERLTFEMGVNTTQASQTTASHAVTTQVRDNNFAIIAQHHILYFATAIDN